MTKKDDRLYEKIYNKYDGKYDDLVEAYVQLSKKCKVKKIRVGHKIIFLKNTRMSFL